MNEQVRLLQTEIRADLQTIARAYEESWWWTASPGCWCPHAIPTPWLRPSSACCVIPA